MCIFEKCYYLPLNKLSTHALKKFMDPIDISYELRKHRSSQADIAKKLKVTRSAVCQVVYGVRSTPRIQRAIASVINRKVEDIWPDTVRSI